MDRRQILTAGVGFAAPLAFGATAARAQGAIDSMKLPILAGGDFSTMTSKLALRRGQHPALRSFAKLEIEEQAAVARAFGSRPGAAGLLPKHAALLQQLEAAPQSEFDALYLQGQIKGHRELLALHRSYASSGADPRAMGASIVGVPAIETHLAMLMTLTKAA